MRTRIRKLTNTSKSMIKIILMGVLLISLSSVVYAEANDSSSYEQTSAILSLDEAKEIAAFSVAEFSEKISDFSEWKGASIESDITYYDLDGNKTAYVFNVVKNDEYSGFIIISATKDKYPILEFSKGKLPHKISYMVKESQSAATNYANKNKLKVGKSVPIYGGATFYYTEYELKDNKNAAKGKIIVDDITSNVTSLEAETAPINNHVETVESNEIKEVWNSLESKMAGDISTTATYSRKISNFPAELWYRGCAPTSAAMVLEYWDNHGYPNFPTGHTLIDELANAMGTTSGGSTITNNIDNGIETVCSNHGYSNIDAITENDVTKTKIQTEINASRPFTLSMVNGGVGSGYSQNQPYGNHTVACYGYYRSGLVQYDYIHDTWQTAEHYIVYGSWEWATNTWVRP